MTNGEMIQSMFPNMNFGTLAQDDVIVNRDYSNNDELQVFIPKSVWNAEYKEPTNKNNLPHCQCTDAEIAELFIEDVEAVKDQLPTAKNDLGVDCVSRQAVIEITAETGALETQDRVKALPSVIPQEPRKGHWIWELDETPSTPISPYELNYAGWVCSCCHEFPDNICEWDNPDEPPTYKFCPNCGAEIESEDKE